VVFQDDAAIVQHGCVRKCGHRDPYKWLGGDDFSAGFDPSLSHEADAICLPREDCEALCSSLSDCASIDMHRTLPRCYLNRVSTNCTYPHSDAAWDFLSKTALPGTEAMEEDLSRVMYLTRSYSTCAGSPYAVRTAPREECEAACTETEACDAFVFVPSKDSTCYFYDDCAVLPLPNNTHRVKGHPDTPIEEGALSSVVAKIVPDLCAIHVAGPFTELNGKYTGP
jgi:hypothetical protein